MPKTITTTHPDLDQTLEALIAREDALNAAAAAHGLDVTALNALATLQDAVGFLDLLSEGIAKGLPFDCPEAAASFQWSVMKLAEFNAMLPEDQRGYLTAECFTRHRAALAEAGGASKVGAY